MILKNKLLAKLFKLKIIENGVDKIYCSIVTNTVCII